MLHQLFDPESSTYTYVLTDPSTREAAIIDPVLEQLERDLAFLAEHGLTLRYVLDTHVHADHVTGAGALRERTGAKTGLARAAAVGCADLGLQDGDELPLGSTKIRVIATPGHTDGCLSYHWDGAVFTGDALLIRGSGRTDFQQGSSKRLYASVTERLFTLPDETRVYPAHDYKGQTSSTIGDEKRLNPRFANKSLAEFEKIMSELKLAEPKKIKEAVPANQRCGAPTFFGRSGAERIAAGFHEVSPDWVLREAARSGARLVDVREPHELVGELGRLEGFENVPLATLPEVARSWDKRQPIVVICRSGNRSGKAALHLDAEGFSTVSMRGGMLAVRAAQAPAEARA